jgi:hypothetical protein
MSDGAGYVLWGLLVLLFPIWGPLWLIGKAAVRVSRHVDCWRGRHRWVVAERMDNGNLLRCSNCRKEVKVGAKKCRST